MSATSLKVFWQPGCSSCLRTKEFLARHGVAYESVNVQADAGALAQLRALGARTLPVLADGERHTLCQSLDDVIRFLNLPVTLAPPLAPAQLVERLDLVLTRAAAYTLQFPPQRFRAPFRDSSRSAADIAFHVFRLSEMGLQAAQGLELRAEGFAELPPADWSAADIAAWGSSVRERWCAWWSTLEDRSLRFIVPIDEGPQPMHQLMERTAWHAAHHARQLVLMLGDCGVPVAQPLTPQELQGLPLPENVWTN